MVSVILLLCFSRVFDFRKKYCIQFAHSFTITIYFLIQERVLFLHSTTAKSKTSPRSIDYGGCRGKRIVHATAIVLDVF